MIRAFDQHQLFRLGHGRNQRFQLGARTKLIAGAADKQLGLGAILHEFKCVHAWLFGVGCNRAYGSSNSDDRTNTGVRASRPQSDRCAKRKSSKQKWQMILGVKPVERSVDILNFAVALIVFPVAQASAAEVEAQHRKAKAVQRLHRMEDDFIVQCSAKQRMRMANDSSVRRVRCACVEQSFQASSRAVEKQGSDG